MKLFTIIGDAIWAKLEPRVDKLLDDAQEMLRRELAERVPALVHAGVTAGVKAGSELATNGVDKLTDLVPGELDDKIIDPIAASIVGDVLRRLGL